MSENVTKKEYTIDATNKRLGRVATEAATILLGKDSADFTRNNVANVTVKIENASKMDIPEAKKDTTTYQNYSGYHGGRHVESLGHLSARRGFAEALKRTISGMLPKNKLRKPTLSNLEITE